MITSLEKLCVIQCALGNIEHLKPPFNEREEENILYSLNEMLQVLPSTIGGTRHFNICVKRHNGRVWNLYRIRRHMKIKKTVH